MLLTNVDLYRDDDFYWDSLARVLSRVIVLDRRNKQEQNEGVFGLWPISGQTGLTQHLTVFQQLDFVFHTEAGEFAGQVQALPNYHVHIFMGRRDGGGTLVWNDQH